MFPIEAKIISKILISIVSHGQGDLIKKLLHDLDSNLINSKHSINVVVTINIPENDFRLRRWSTRRSRAWWSIAVGTMPP